MSRRFVAPSWATVVLAVLVTIALGCATWGVVAWRSTPKVLRTATSAPGMLSVSPTTFTDPQDVTFTRTLREGVTLRNPVAGVLTEFACAPGREITSGARLGMVGQRSIVAVHTARPLWRALTVGSTGRDVEGLTKELARLGQLPAKHVSTRLSAEGFRAAMTLAGREGAVLELGDLVWIPSQSVRVGTCNAQVGQTLDVGIGLLTQAPTIVNLQTATDMAAFIPGPRVVTLFGRTAPVVDGRVEDPALLAAVSAANLGHEMPSRDGQPVPLPARLELAEPLWVVSVPAGIIKVDGDDACVSVDGLAQKVTVISSTLGRTLVSFPKPPHHVDLELPVRCTS